MGLNGTYDADAQGKGGVHNWLKEISGRGGYVDKFFVPKANELVDHFSNHDGTDIKKPQRGNAVEDFFFGILKFYKLKKWASEVKNGRVCDFLKSQIRNHPTDFKNAISGLSGLVPIFE